MECDFGFKQTRTEMNSDRVSREMDMRVRRYGVPRKHARERTSIILVSQDLDGSACKSMRFTGCGRASTSSHHIDLGSQQNIIKHTRRINVLGERIKMNN